MALLKSLGAQNNSIKKIFIQQSIRILLKGLFWGNLVSLILCYLQKKFELITLSKEVYYVSTIPISIELTAILLINLATIVICFFSILIPANYVSKIKPINAIKFQ